MNPRRVTNAILNHIVVYDYVNNKAKVKSSHACMSHTFEIGVWDTSRIEVWCSAILSHFNDFPVTCKFVDVIDYL